MHVQGHAMVRSLGSAQSSNTPWRCSINEEHGGRTRQHDIATSEVADQLHEKRHATMSGMHATEDWCITYETHARARSNATG